MSLVWVHEDAMTLDHPVFRAAGPEAQPIFIWDSAEHERRGYSFKRRVFIFECAYDLNIPIHYGPSLEVLTELADDHVIYAAAAHDPDLGAVFSKLGKTHDVRIIPGDPLVEIPSNTDTGRFFRFWNRARKSALTHSADRLFETKMTSSSDVN